MTEDIIGSSEGSNDGRYNRGPMTEDIIGMPATIHLDWRDPIDRIRGIYGSKCVNNRKK
jgi:hypothetical protein